MMELQEQKTTSCSQKMGRELYLKQCKDKVESRLQIALQKTKWSPLESLRLPTKAKLLCRCSCGREHRVRVSDILCGGSLQCRACSDRAWGDAQKTPLEELKRRAEVGVKVREENRLKAWGYYWDTYTHLEVQRVRSIASGARSRCTNKNNKAYVNYGGRGVKCKFPTTEIMTKWLLDNLGIRPSDKHSIDRIDNNGHYEPGNIRWASPLEQARNKRQYKRTQRGEQIRYILSQRQDISHECARAWLKQGVSVEQILNRSKHDRACI